MPWLSRKLLQGFSQGSALTEVREFQSNRLSVSIWRVPFSHIESLNRKPLMTERDSKFMISVGQKPSSTLPLNSAWLLVHGVRKYPNAPARARILSFTSLLRSFSLPQTLLTKACGIWGFAKLKLHLCVHWSPQKTLPRSNAVVLEMFLCYLNYANLVPRPSTREFVSTE